MPRLRITIVTPSFNQARFIGRTIDSVLAQQGPFDLDYRVVDGASSDGTIELLRSYGESLQWTSEPDSGQVAAINRGLREAKGDVLGWLNSDDVLYPGALSRVAAAFEEHPGAAWLHGRCDIIDEHDKVVRRWISLYKHLRARRHTIERLIVENYVSQMTAFWRRSAQQTVGLLDASLNFAFDYDLWLRLSRRGAPLYLDGPPLAAFRWYRTSKSGRQFESQFREDAEVAARHAAGHRWLLRRKRLTTAAILTVYRAMAGARARQ